MDCEPKGLYHTIELRDDEVGGVLFMLVGPGINDPRAISSPSKTAIMKEASARNTAYVYGRSSRNGLREALEKIKKHTETVIGSGPDSLSVRMSAWWRIADEALAEDEKTK